MSRYFIVNVPKTFSADISRHPKIIEEVSKNPNKEWEYTCAIVFDTTNFMFHIRPAIAEGDTEVNEVLEVKDIVNFIKDARAGEAIPGAQKVSITISPESFLRKVLESHNVHNLHIQYMEDMAQFTFPNQMDDNDDIIGSLHRLGIGNIFGCFSLLPVDLGTYMEKKENTFSDTVKTRLVLIEQMIRNITENSEFTFDFVVMILSAGILAGVGLATDNSVVVVASMLVSPLMGPILGMTFGIMIHDRLLVKQSFITEIYGLLLCLLSGFLVGICGFALCEDYWPTPQMESRGMPWNLLIGVAIASPSGVGAALSISGSNMAGVVGVAISASLLPPAVNCGLLITWALFGHALFGAKVAIGENLFLALISFLLTIVNIICIIIFGLGTFLVKEVANLPGKTSFWKEDVKKIRAEFDVQNQKTAKGKEGLMLQKELDSVLKNKNGCCGRNDYSHIEQILQREGIGWSKLPSNKTIASYKSTQKDGLQHEIELMSIFNKPPQ